MIAKDKNGNEIKIGSRVSYPYMGMGVRTTELGAVVGSETTPAGKVKVHVKLDGFYGGIKKVYSHILAVEPTPETKIFMAEPVDECYDVMGRKLEVGDSVITADFNFTSTASLVISTVERFEKISECSGGKATDQGVVVFVRSDTTDRILRRMGNQVHKHAEFCPGPTA